MLPFCGDDKKEVIFWLLLDHSKSEALREGRQAEIAYRITLHPYVMLRKLNVNTIGTLAMFNFECFFAVIQYIEKMLSLVLKA